MDFQTLRKYMQIKTDLVRKKTNLIVILLLILFIGTFLRFVQLDSNPPALYQDESAIGFNAYSILETGKDEHGEDYPLYFQSFGDYKLPVYIYLTSISIKLFGLNEFAVRFPSALFGSLAILIVFLFVRKLSHNDILSLIVAFFIAINPQHIFFSRAGFEVNVANTFLLFGLYLFVIYIQKKQLIIGLFSALLFALSLYSYNVTRMLVPILVLILLISFKKELRKIPIKHFVGIGGISFLLILPFISTLLGSSGLASAGGVLIFSQDTFAKHIEMRSYLETLPQLYVKLLYNNYIMSIFTYFTNFAKILSGTFFFVEGTQHGNQGMGNVGYFYLYDLPLFIIGIIYSFKWKLAYLKIAFLWLIIDISILALSKDVPHATRGFFLIVPVVIFSGLGLFEIILYIRNFPKLFRYCLVFVGAFIIFFNVQFFLASYFLRFPKVYASNCRHEDKELVDYLKLNEAKYDEIIIDRSANVAYTSILFYLPFDPKLFVESARYEQDGNLIAAVSFGKYIFRPIDWNSDLKRKNVLIITNDKKKEYDDVVIHIIKNPKKYVVISVNDSLVQYPEEETKYILIESRR